MSDLSAVFRMSLAQRAELMDWSRDEQKALGVAAHKDGYRWVYLPTVVGGVLMVYKVTREVASGDFFVNAEPVGGRKPSGKYFRADGEEWRRASTSDEPVPPVNEDMQATLTGLARLAEACGL